MARRIVLRVSLAAFEPLTWEEAYEQAEATLARMNVPLLQVSGLCDRQSFANNLLFQDQGKTASGSPYYAVAGYYIYRDPSCDGKKDTASRWILSVTAPNSNRHSDLDDDGECSKEAHTTAGNTDGPPMGTHTWQMRCDEDSDELSGRDVTLRMVPQGEKYSLLRGLGWEHPPGGGWWDLRKWWYIGNTVAIPRLDIPSLNMQDAAGGFRTNFPELGGTVTVWPSLLAMGATWDAAVVRAFGEALGREFKGKGANAILGPSVNVHRVARNGRNFEYMSGEDPVLGSQLAAAYVKGVQSEGIFAVVKHWVFNEQELNRGSESSNVDEKTKWEIYYPPFRASVDAGVSAVMCSYNKVDGVYSCSNEHEFKVLKERMGFKGFVQSDWWATHATSIEQGLDQEMPGSGSGDSHPEYFAADELEEADQKAVDDAAKRVLAVIHRMKLSESTKCSPPHCKEWFMKHVTTDAHVNLARVAAATSVVLLQNKNDVLPLSHKDVKKIAIIGSAADAPSYDPNGQGQGHGDWATGDYYSGGGSGHLSGDVVSAAKGIKDEAQSLGIDVVTSFSNEVEAGVHAAKQADVAIVVAGTTSGESRDRVDLNLDDDADKLIGAVQRAATTIVLVQAPGAVVMPWRDSVDGILIMFLGGQETGTAWADVLFGDHAPTGRLPIMLPATEADSIPPGTAGSVPYSEGMETSYRSKSFKAAFPFGHGLTYTTFEHSPLVNETCDDVQDCQLRIRTDVKNTGHVAAPTVVQLYLEFPVKAGLPAPFLKAFKKTSSIQPGSTEQVVFDLSSHDISYYDVGVGELVKATGTFHAHVGESSADIRNSLRFCVGGCDTQPTGLFRIVGTVIALAAVGVGSWLVCCRKSAGGAGTDDARPLVSRGLQHDA
eukprot:CAMPEP_0115499498 /NCGR_PEP_ID=MMETSP0271-20121206/67369_1 /TAXON_ID=71861 /ORGANISM="Scrippsiella trochoidea, Strain CCMP3099" /LENGTH=884 /DNA_ID=CAMNT_0002928315 /DNA_START=51 /DNA_END=2705 /DNA_ORIENTATION=+